MSDENRNDDDILEFIERSTTATNDAAAGETVLPGAGDGNNGPTGGSPREFEPEYQEHAEHDDENDAPQDLDGDEGTGLGDDGL